MQVTYLWHFTLCNPIRESDLYTLFCLYLKSVFLTSLYFWGPQRKKGLRPLKYQISCGHNYLMVNMLFEHFDRFNPFVHNAIQTENNWFIYYRFVNKRRMVWFEFFPAKEPEASSFHEKNCLFYNWWRHKYFFCPNMYYFHKSMYILSRDMTSFMKDH